MDQAKFLEWKREYEKATERQPERRSKFETSSGIPLKPLYTPQDLEGLEYDRDLGNPCQVPFARGIYPTMYRTQLWTKRMLIGHETPEIFNVRQKRMLEAGTTGINLIPCNSFMRGCDSDEAEEELLGRCGTTIDSLQDMEMALKDIPLDQVTLGLNDPGPFIMLAMCIASAERQGIPLERLRGTSNQSDFISHYIGCNMFFRFPLEGHLRMLMDHITFCHQHLPQWNCLSIVGQHVQQGGATPVQALGFTLAGGIFYVEEGLKAGLKAEELVPRFTFFFDSSCQFFEEIAKFRAARRMWARILQERFGIQDPRALRLKFHAQTSGAELTAAQPLNNIARVTLQALAAILGGVQSLHTDAYDEALWSPTEEAARIALMTQNILAEESGVADIIDPLGGSYFLETLTNQVEERAWQIIAKIDELGGMYQAVKRGYPQKEIARSAYEQQQRTESGEKVVVGINKYVAIEEDGRASSPSPEVRRDLIAQQIARTRRLKRERDPARTREALDRLREMACSPQGNIFAAVIEAVKAQATQGEITRTLRGVYGLGQPFME